MSGSLQDLVDQIFHRNDGGAGNGGDRVTDSGSQTIIIEIDELLSGYNLPFVYRDIVNATSGFGDIAFCYTRVVHPIICELFNGSITDNASTTNDQLRAIQNWRFEDNVADHIEKSAEQKIWEVVNTSRRLIEVNTQDVLKFCVHMLDNILGRIIDSASDYGDNITGGRGNAFIQLDQRSTGELIPANSPNILRVVVQYSWIYI